MKKILLLLFVLLSACGIYIYQNSVQSSNSQISFYGNVEKRTKKLSFSFLGTVKCVTKDEGQKFSKGDILASLDTTPLHYQIEQLQAQIEAETTILQKLKSGHKTADIKAQVKKVAALEAQRKTLLHNLQEATITAPTEGTILTRYVEPASVVTPAQNVLEIALQDEYWVRAYAVEAQIGKITQGQKMLVYTDIREEPYEGYVGFISPVTEFTPKNIETPQIRPNLVYRFRVIITNPSSTLKQGLPVTVKTL